MNMEATAMNTRNSRKRKQEKGPEQEMQDAAVMTSVTKRRRGKEGRAIAQIQRKQKKEASISQLPAEVLEEIFSFVDVPTLIKNCTMVCKQWKSVINGAPSDKLPKFVYREITVTEQNGFEVKLERNTHSDNRPPPGEAGSKKPRRLLKSIRRERPKIDRLPKYLRHITCKKLVFQSLSGSDFTKMLRDFTFLCLDAKIIAFDFCNFANIKKDLVLRFLKPRKDRLTEVALSSCRNLETCMQQEEFLQGIGELQGHYPTYRLKDHYASSQTTWKDRLAEIILETRPLWILDLDGISPAMTAVEDRLKRWLRPLKAEEETGRPPLDVLSLEPQNIQRKNMVIKFENSRSTRLFTWWRKTIELLPYPAESLPVGGAGNSSQDQPAPAQPEAPPLPNGKTYWKNPPKICKILETCFDGQRRYSAHRSKVVITDLDGKRFSVYLQR